MMFSLGVFESFCHPGETNYFRHAVLHIFASVFVLYKPLSISYMLAKVLFSSFCVVVFIALSMMLYVAMSTLLFKKRRLSYKLLEKAVLLAQRVNG
ncbi:hypothetical protein [Plesiomonas shigelloides]|uniref:hypothetical protein n=1 Tax=Plesiomonas shigelloides TaxID=703 RepID=UPI002247BDCD|nr:hypothetical protein [Plesiomonas shigelloides]MCX2497259.1 hypothetical protein [Plesiomonas shigelloides]